MGNSQYGGRYSTNFIDDIKPPANQRGLVPVREGLSGFRPLEEVAGNFINMSPPHRPRHSAGIRHHSSGIPINVRVKRPRAFMRSAVPQIRKPEVKQWAASLADYLERQFGNDEQSADYRFDESSVETMKLAGITLVLMFGLLVFSHDLLNNKLSTPSQRPTSATQSKSTPAPSNGVTKTTY